MTQAAQHLIGEELVDAVTVYAFATRMADEAERIWSSPAEHWCLLSDSDGITNEGSKVAGVFEPSGVEITRAHAVVDANADALFELLASPEGYKLIDPFTDPKDHDKPPVEVFDVSRWEPRVAGDKRRRLEAANAIAKIPLLATREFVVLNAIDYNARSFFSNSIQHEAIPGTSVYGPDGYVEPANGHVRALNTFGVQIEPLAEDPKHRCVVRTLNFADMGGSVPTFASNLINMHFLTGLIDRMRKAMAAA